VVRMFNFLAMSTGGTGGDGNPMFFFGYIALMFGVFYFLILRPNAKRQKEHKSMLGSVQKGDKITTNGGLIVTVLNVKEDKIVCTISDGIKIEIARNAVSSVARD
jgi:preprotein translocase subunit YajC